MSEKSKLGLTQVPLFVLQYENPKGNLTFLKKGKKVGDNKI